MNKPIVDVFERLQKLPAVAFVDNAGGKANACTCAPIVAARRGVSECYPIFTPLTADELNSDEGVTKA